ncbi:MAG: protein kinase [Bryobacteraceae bacterium]
MDENSQITRTAGGADNKPDAVAERFPAGTLLGHYTIQKRLGQGGMGLVYEAVDQKLHRSVAIKVLPAANAEAEDRARFLREAQSASALNHPNIVTIYEAGHQDGMDFIVMERVDGRTLRQAIGQKGLDFRTALSYAVQIAEAVAAAHDAGIVHRDLKPGNVMVTGRGLVKVLDFGLAKRQEQAGPDVTADVSLTRAGHVVGTAAYMSPEQAQGYPVDARSDIFSFGSVLYEMLTGVRAFQEDSQVATLAAILHKDPAALPDRVPGGPPRLTWVMTKCMQKKPHDRWQNMQDVKLVLEDLLHDLDQPAAGAGPVAATGARSRGLWAGVVLGAAVLGALLTYAAVRRRSEPAPVEPVYRMLTADSGLNDDPALSRDGKFIAFASDRAGRNNLDIWVQQIGGREAIQLTHDGDDETDPAFSPDGTRIAYRSERNGGGISVVQTLGGDPVMIAAGGRNPRYSPDGKWIAYWTGSGEGSFAPGSSHVFVVDANGGQPRPIHPEMAVAQFPIWSPRGDRLLVQGSKGTAESEDFWMLPVDGGDVRPTGVVPEFKARGFRALPLVGMFVETAALDWIDAGGNRLLSALALGDSANLWETRLDGHGRLQGSPHRLTRGPGRQAHASWAVTDTVERLAFSDETANYHIWTLPERAGGGSSVSRLTDSIATEWAPALSSDGKKLLYIVRRSGSWALLLRELPGGHERVLTSSPELLVNAAISGDGLRAAYTSADFSILSIPTAGGEVEKLCDHCGTVLSLSPDGRYVAYEPVKDEDVLVFDSAGHRSIRLARRPKPDVILSGTRLSPDGKWMAFHAVDHATRRTQVWIAPVDLNRPAEERDWIPVTDGRTFAQDPCWAPDAAAIYFVSEGDGFRCLWGQRLDRTTRRPSGEPFALAHFHSARQTLRGAGSQAYLLGLSAAAGQVVFSMAEVKGTIWLEEKPHVR